ncbi:MAG: hypothetical protein ACO36I_21575 [Candidatus Latescibacterota bacterium]
MVTDGATKVETINRLQEALNARVTGLIISVDRKEKNAEGGNAITALSNSTGVEIRAIITIHDILEYLPGREIDGQIPMTKEIQKQIEAYLAEYGVKE